MSPAVDVDGERLAWRERGSGPTLLLLHGLGGSRLSWEPQLDGLSAEHRVVAWDMPGYGASAPLAGQLTFLALADAVVDLLDSLGVLTAHVAGISFGGMIAQHAAARHPARLSTLALLSTSPKFGLDGTKPAEWRAARLAPLEAGLEPAEFADDVLAAIAGPNIAPEALAGQRAAMARISGAALRRSIDCLVTHDSTAVLPSISAPTLCMVGELDEETPIGYGFALADLIPGARLAVIPGAGHLLNVEAPDDVNRLLEEHMARAASECT
ncbi:MAG TPA: alpha/beta fold hydrolase [Ilumatobacteraceae bacterium]